MYIHKCLFSADGQSISWRHTLVVFTCRGNCLYSRHRWGGGSARKCHWGKEEMRSFSVHIKLLELVHECLPKFIVLMFVHSLGVRLNKPGFGFTPLQETPFTTYSIRPTIQRNNKRMNFGTHPGEEENFKAVFQLNYWLNIYQIPKYIHPNKHTPTSQRTLSLLIMVTHSIGVINERTAIFKSRTQ